MISTKVLAPAEAKVDNYSRGAGRGCRAEPTTQHGRDLAANDQGVSPMRKLFAAFGRDESGLTMVEYAIAGTLVTLGALAAFTSLGLKIASAITSLANAF